MADNNLFDELKSRKLINVKDNRLRLIENIDMSMYGSRSWAFTLQKIGEKKGEEFLFKKDIIWVKYQQKR